MTMDFIEFWTICSSNNIVLDKEQIWQLERYHNEMIYWNEKVNLISRKDEQNFLEKHILHSLTVLKYFEFPSKTRMLDVGTGGGLPGIPLAIAKPDIQAILVDSIAKKIKVTDMFAKHTGLKTIRTIATRVEEMQGSGQFNNYFDVIVSRAVAKIPSVISWVNKMIKSNGVLILWKGGEIDEEIESVYKQFKNIKIDIIDINMLGAEYFMTDHKKLVFCRGVN